jgi:hypothetical protein
MSSSKNILGLYLVKYFEIKKNLFSDFQINKCGKSPVIFAVSYIPGSLGAYLPPLTPSTTTSCPGIPPANSRCTKQF